METLKSGAMVGLAALVATCIFGQDSRPTPSSKPAAAQAAAEPFFEPDQYNKDSIALFELAKARLITDWVVREKPKPVRTAAQVDVSKELKGASKQAADSYAFDNNIPAVRGQIEKVGLLHKSGARVLPLGRLEWEKPAPYLKDGEKSKTAVLAVLVATDKLPRGDVKGFRVKGEFEDRDGKRLVDFNQKSLYGFPSNGVFLLVMPAGNTLKDAPEFCGFKFKLQDVQVIK